MKKQLKELREKANLSQNEFAKRAKVSAAYINKIEKGAYNTLSIDTCRKLADGLKMTLRDFLEAIGQLSDETTPKTDLTLMSALRARKLSDEQVNQVMSYINYVQQNDAK